MPREVYPELQRQLDRYFLGFPATESGIELRVLEKLFSGEDAETFLVMTLQAEAPQEIAARLGRDPEELAARLDDMAERGLLFRSRTGKAVKYGAVPFLPGIWEFQLATMDRELAELLEQYDEQGMLRAKIDGAALFMRTVPVNKDVVVSHHIAAYDDAREVIRRAKTIALAECICRKEQGLIDHGCDKPREVCLLFGSSGQYYLDRGMGREVDVEEALRVLDQAQEAGLVTQLSTSQNPSGMCNCCGDCCVVLRALNRDPKPAEKVFSNYFAKLDADQCTACGSCVDRCQMAAITISDEGIAAIDPDRCIGCGLCAARCPQEALVLESKREDLCVTPPARSREQTMAMAERRGISIDSLLPAK